MYYVLVKSITEGTLALLYFNDLYLPKIYHIPGTLLAVIYFIEFNHQNFQLSNQV